VATLDPEVDRLFEVPLEEFIAARNELVRRLKSDGDAAAAEEVKRLTKPSVAAWTINQLSRQRTDAVGALLAAGAKLREAQERALQSKGDAGNALRQAQEDERRAIRGLAHQAQEILEDAGRPVSSTLLDRISSTLRAAAVSDAGRAALEAGRLSGDVKPSGFDALAGLELAKAPRRGAAPARDELAERRREKKEREQKRRELRDRARTLASEAAEAEHEADRAEREAVAARNAAEKKRRAADRAEQELEELES
jgi:hypothetical protein